MRSRLPLLFAPTILAGSLLLAAPTTVRAADGLTETGTTTYEVVPGKNVISVTVSLSIYNGKPSTANYTYFWSSTQIAVINEAGPVSVTSNAGAVSQSLAKTDEYYRYLTLNYPNVYYGQTRVVTATYAIPAGPHAKGGFRAVAAYAGLCVAGNGADSGTVSVVIPDGFALHVDSGGGLTRTTDAEGKQVYSSGTQSAPSKFRACIDAENSSSLTHTSTTAGGQVFDIGAWPEDPTWATAVQTKLADVVQQLEGLTGLSMPGGPVQIMEVGDWQLGEYGGAYNATTATAYVPETVLPATIADGLSHIWFNRKTFAADWASEGLAGYSAQVAGAGNSTPCGDPGPYPGSDSPALSTWLLLGNDATAQEKALANYQDAASCYIIASLAKAMGPDNFKAVMKAAAAGEMAYIGATPGEKAQGAGPALSAQGFLDLVDERGMFPAGIENLDQAQALLATFGIFNSTTLAGRSQARTTYHALATAADNWKLPLAVRAPMASWDFAGAEKAMATSSEILGVRDGIEKLLSGFSLDGTSIQQAFEGATGQTDLDSLLTLIKKEADAAGAIDRATKLRDGNGIFQTVGLLGTDIETPLKQATTDLANVRPDSAGARAQSVIDQIQGSRLQGIVRLGVLLALLLAIAFLVVLNVFIRRPRNPVPVLAGDPTQVEPVSSVAPAQATGLPAGSSDEWSGGPLAQPGMPWPTPAGDLGSPLADAPPRPAGHRRNRRWSDRPQGIPAAPPRERRRGERRTQIPPDVAEAARMAGIPLVAPRERRRAERRTQVPPSPTEAPIVEETPAAAPQERRGARQHTPVPPEVAEALVVEKVPSAAPQERRRARQQKPIPPQRDRRRAGRQTKASDDGAGPAPGE